MMADAFHIVPVISCDPQEDTTYVVVVLREDEPTLILTPSGLLPLRDLYGPYGRSKKPEQAQAAIDAYDRQQHDQGAA